MLLVTLGRNLRDDLVLALFKVYLAADGSVSARVDRADSAQVVSGLAALFPHDEMKAEPVLTLQASEVPCVQLKSKSAFEAVHNVRSVT